MENRLKLEKTGEKLLTNTRTSLYLAMRFMGPAFMSLGSVMDPGARSMGTDAKDIRWNPLWIMQTWLEHPYIVMRTYLHSVLHCIFRHMYGLDTHPDHELWDLACDIAVESVIDSMDYEIVHRTPDEYREEWFARLTGELRVLTAEKLYRYFSDAKPDYGELMKLSAEFRADDHVFWEQMSRGNKPDKNGSGAPDEPGEEEWKKTAKRVESELMFSRGKAGTEAGDLARLLRFELREKLPYRDLLKKFAVIREECRVDPDSFDYGFYNYGMELFGNMPLIEENEFAESGRISELVIAIDTSASVDQRLLESFLTDTASILLRKEAFFRHFTLCILECDARVHNVRVIRDSGDMERLAGGIELHGGGGTDFRPVFSWVEERRRAGGLRSMEGLLYFSDGFGIFPKKPPSWTCAFILPEENAEETIPDWVLKAYL